MGKAGKKQKRKPKIKGADETSDARKRIVNRIVEQMARPKSPTEMRPGPGDLVVGKKYFGVLCKVCRKHIPMAADDAQNPKTIYTPPGAKDLAVFCPYCGHNAEYSPSELKSRTLTALPPELH
jgi:hypothetical protein